MDTQQQPAPALAGYMQFSEWVSKHAGAVFGTKSAADWFVRQHRRELIEANALLPREGRAGSLVDIDKFPRAVIKILKRRALEKTGPAA